jgi:hypothetical protein
MAGDTRLAPHHAQGHQQENQRQQGVQAVPEGIGLVKLRAQGCVQRGFEFVAVRGTQVGLEHRAGAIAAQSKTRFVLPAILAEVIEQEGLQHRQQHPCQAPPHAVPDHETVNADLEHGGMLETKDVRSLNESTAVGPRQRLTRENAEGQFPKLPSQWHRQGSSDDFETIEDFGYVLGATDFLPKRMIRIDKNKLTQTIPVKAINLMSNSLS